MGVATQTGDSSYTARTSSKAQPSARRRTDSKCRTTASWLDFTVSTRKAAAVSARYHDTRTCDNIHVVRQKRIDLRHRNSKKHDTVGDKINEIICTAHLQTLQNPPTCMAKSAAPNMLMACMSLGNWRIITSTCLGMPERLWRSAVSSSTCRRRRRRRATGWRLRHRGEKQPFVKMCTVNEPCHVCTNSTKC